MCSSTFPGVGIREIGQWSETFLEFFTLGIGITIAFFHLSGTLVVVRLKLSKYVNSGSRMDIASLISLLQRSGIGWIIFN